jgi:MFS family permease
MGLTNGHYWPLGIIQVASAIFLILATQLIKKKAGSRLHDRLFFLAVVLLSVSVIILPLKGSFLFGLVFFCLYSFGRGLFRPLKAKALNDCLTNSNRATMLSVDSLMNNVVSAPFFFLAPAIKQGMGNTGPWILAGVLFACLFPVVMRIIRPQTVR